MTAFKRFIVIHWQDHETYSGLHEDIDPSFDTKEEALLWVEREKPECWQVFDCDERRIVGRGTL